MWTHQKNQCKEKKHAKAHKVISSTRKACKMNSNNKMPAEWTSWKLFVTNRNNVRIYIRLRVASKSRSITSNLFGGEEGVSRSIRIITESMCSGRRQKSIEFPWKILWFTKNFFHRSVHQREVEHWIPSTVIATAPSIAVF